MALRRKPQSESKKAPSADEHHIEALIDKGGSVAPDHEEGKGIKPPTRPAPSAPFSCPAHRQGTQAPHCRAVPSYVAARSTSREAGN